MICNVVFSELEHHTPEPDGGGGVGKFVLK